MSKWQPIKTAPKDGTWVWAYLYESGIRRVFWQSAEMSAAEEGGSPGDYVAGWYEVDDHDEGWTPHWWLPQSAISEPPK